MDRYTYQYEAADENATADLGAALAQALPDGTVVALYGTLGAGKTRLVQAIAEADGVDRRDVVSPTFVLMQPYQGRRPIYHFDAYRLRDEDEFEQLGPEEYYESKGVTLIEWADRVSGCLPQARVDISIEVTGDQSRRFEIRGYGPQNAEAVRRLQEQIR